MEDLQLFFSDQGRIQDFYNGAVSISKKLQEYILKLAMISYTDKNSTDLYAAESEPDIAIDYIASYMYTMYMQTGV